MKFKNSCKESLAGTGTGIQQKHSSYTSMEKAFTHLHRKRNIQNRCVPWETSSHICICEMSGPDPEPQRLLWLHTLRLLWTVPIFTLRQPSPKDEYATSYHQRVPEDLITGKHAWKITGSAACALPPSLSSAPLLLTLLPLRHLTPGAGGAWAFWPREERLSPRNPFNML